MAKDRGHKVFGFRLLVRSVAAASIGAVLEEPCLSIE